MALSMGGDGRRRRWSCRAARRGNGGAACRHFHVHYHIPRQGQVWALFSPPRLPPRFLLVPFLLILPVLFLAVLAFLVCFGWLTLLYLASSLWSRGPDRAGDANEFEGEDEPEGRALNAAHHPGLSEVCVEGKDEKEVGDGFSQESGCSTGICINDDEEKIVKEVVMLEKDWKGLKTFAELDVFTEKHDQLVTDIPIIDCFLEELNTEEFSTSIDDTTKLLDVLSIGEVEVFDANTKEVSVLSSTEIFKVIDKHDTAKILVNCDGTDFMVPEVTSSDDSTSRSLGEEYTEIKQEQSPAELSVNTVSEKLPEDVTDEWQETQTLVVEHNNRQPEAASNGEYRNQTVGILDESHDFLCAEDVTDEWQETQTSVVEHNKQPEAASNEEYRNQIVGISDESHDSLYEMAGLPLDSVCESILENVTASSTLFHQIISDKGIELQQDPIQHERVESSTSASVACDFADNHWRILEELDSDANEENVHEEDTSVLETIGEEDEDTEHYASMGAPRRLALVRRPPALWWNLCGVLDVFAGGKD